jgi:YHS domain-containing protein
MKALRTFILVALTSFSAQAQQPQPAAAPDDALDGVDTVILLKEGKEVFGKAPFRSQYGGLGYLFSSAATKAEFDSAPEKYAVQMGGLCARMGKTVTGNPSDYIVHDGKIYLFGSDACHKAFAAAPEKYLPKPAAPMPTDPAAVANGQALLDKVVASIGGAGLDSLTTYVESTSEQQKRPTGDVKVEIRKMWKFPDAARSDRTLPMSDGRKATFGTLLTSTGAFGIGGDRVTPVIPEALPSVQQDMWREIVPLLHGRHEGGVAVAALGSGTVDGAVVERVRVRRAGLDVTLNVDPKSGRVHSTTFVDRGPGGQFGEITMIYGNFKNVDGLILPHTQRALFNGVAEDSMSHSIDTIKLNVRLDAALFNPAVRGGGAR